MPTWQNKSIFLFLTILALFLAISEPVSAGMIRHKGPPTQKFLTQHKIKLMSRHVALDLNHQALFSKSDLPSKMSIGLFEVKVSDATVTSRQFTDAVLNAILNDTAVVILNQDLQLGDSLDFQLQRYEDHRTLRVRAGLLGANYDIVGSISDYSITLKPGKVQQGYKIEYQVYDVHTNQSLIQRYLIFLEGGKLWKEKTPHGRREKSKS